MPSFRSDPHTFVLVHGAWHGGWCWSRVAPLLRAAGNTVYTPTLTGLGERSHLLAPDITLDTFIEDIVNTLIWEDLTGVTLVGHSFAGLVISAVADRVPERVRDLVYLDAFLFAPGQSAFDALPAPLVERMRAAATERGGIPPLEPKHLGLESEADRAFVAARLCPHPLGTYAAPLRMDTPLGSGKPVRYVRCTQPRFAGIDAAYDWARARYPEWDWQTLAAGHDAMVSAPELTVQALMRR